MDPILLRFLERLTAVLIGGLAIYLGYRLFQSVPEQRDSAGHVELPWNVSIVVSRVGPGVFFALFGTAAVGLSLLQPLEISRKSANGAAQGIEAFYQKYGIAPPRGGVDLSPFQFGQAAGGDGEARANARAELQRDFARLNSLPQLVPEAEREATANSVARIKLALLRALWGTADEQFGDLDAFARWVEAGADGEPPADSPAATALWRYGEPPS